MAGILIVRPNIILSAKELVSCQQSITKMLKDGVVVIQPGYDVSYIRTDEYDADELKVGFE